MDNPIFTAPYQAYTTAELEAKLAAGTVNAKMSAEVARRHAVAAGDMTNSTAGERLDAARR